MTELRCASTLVLVVGVVMNVNVNVNVGVMEKWQCVRWMPLGVHVSWD